MVLAVLPYQIDQKPVNYDRSDRMAAGKRITALLHKMEGLIGPCPQKYMLHGFIYGKAGERGGRYGYTVLEPAWEQEQDGAKNYDSHSIPAMGQDYTMEFNTSFRRLKKASCTDRSHWDGPIAYRDWRKKAMAPAPANRRRAAAIRTAGQTDLFFIRHFLSVYLFNYTLFLWKIT